MVKGRKFRHDAGLRARLRGRFEPCGRESRPSRPGSIPNYDECKGDGDPHRWVTVPTNDGDGSFFLKNYVSGLCLHTESPRGGLS